MSTIRLVRSSPYSRQSLNRGSRDDNWSEVQKWDKDLVAQGASRWGVCLVAQRAENWALA